MDSKVPVIRFKGFLGSWTAKKLADLTESGFSNGVFNDPEKVGRGYRLINVKDMYVGNSIDVENLSLLGIDEKEFIKNKVEYGDIFFTRSSLVKDGIAYSNVNLSNHKDLTYDGHLIRMQPCKKITVPMFLASLFKTASARKQFIVGGKTTTMTTIGQSEIAEVEVAIPSLKEQTKIGNYFQQLDTLIAQHQKKHDKLLNLKKALLEKMFPKQGAELPEVRFKGFSGEWEERGLLSNFEKIIDFRGRTPKKLGLSWCESGYLALSALNVKNGYIDFSVEPHYGNQELYDKWMLGNELHKNQVLFTTEAPMGNIAQVPDNKKYILSQRTIAFEVNPKLIKEDYLTVMLGTPLILQKLTSLSSGGTAKGVSQKSLSSVDILVTNDLNEQTKIGKFFKKLDSLLNQHQTQLKKLKQIKQACLAKMFA